MRLTVAYLLIALLAFVVYQGQAVDSHYVVEHSPRRAVARSGLQTVQVPKFQPAKPDINKTHPNKSKLRQLHYIPYIKKQHILSTPHRAKKHTGHTHRNNLMPLRPHLYTLHAITVLPQTLHQHKQTPKLVYVATTPRPWLVANKTRDVAINKLSSPPPPTKIEFYHPAPAHALQSPALFTASTMTTTATITTTLRPKRVKRIWPAEKTTITTVTTAKAPAADSANSSTDSGDAAAASVPPEPASQSASSLVALAANMTGANSTARPAYSRFTRKPKRSTSRRPTTNVIQPDDWIPILPSHIAHRRSGSSSHFITPARPLTLYRRAQHSPQVGYTSQYADPYTFYARDPYLNSKSYSAYSGSRGARIVGDTLVESTGNHHVVTKIKHHHHHHHHKYVKTVEKPVRVPVKVVVPRPYPVERRVPVETIVHKVVEKKVPVPYTVEKKVPYPIEIKVPQPYPIKVIEKEYIPKPYPVTIPVPVIKHVQVKVPQPFLVPYEKQVPYPVEIKVPVYVEKRVPYPVEVEKKVNVPYPVHVKVYVPQPYPVETKVPYPVEVKVRESETLAQHFPVPVKVYVDKPYPVKVPQAVPVAVGVPYPVEVKKKVPYRVEVDKQVLYPVNVPQPVPVPVEVNKAPYPVRVYGSHQTPLAKIAPVDVAQLDPAHYESAAADRAPVNVYLPHAVPFEKTVPVYIDKDNTLHSPPQVEREHEAASTAPTPHTVTVHGNGNFKGFS